MSGAVISTHTLTWSVTLTVPNVKGDRLISTHTLTWSVTGGGSGQGTAENDFNSHAHVERDDTCTNYFTSFCISTHTLTWSVTRVPGVSCKNIFNFNSHAHVERDRRATMYGKRMCISTHTLTWSVTSGAKEHTLFEKFQLTRSRGA